jgi:hypothetical protein
MFDRRASEEGCAPGRSWEEASGRLPAADSSAALEGSPPPEAEWTLTLLSPRRPAVVRGLFFNQASNVYRCGGRCVVVAGRFD